MERRPTQGSRARDAAKFWLDGSRVWPFSEIYKGKYRADCRAGWPRKFSGRAAARERRALPDGSHRRVGIVFVCACAVRVSTALHGPANRQLEDRRAGERLPMFVGKQASTTTGIARVALHTDAAVVPGYAIWDEASGKYRLRFEPPVELIRTGDMERDVFENTQKFTKVIEEIIRKYPEQWVWVHGRWNTRPAGEPSLYDFQ